MTKPPEPPGCLILEDLQTLHIPTNKKLEVWTQHRLLLMAFSLLPTTFLGRGRFIKKILKSRPDYIVPYSHRLELSINNYAVIIGCFRGSSVHLWKNFVYVIAYNIISQSFKACCQQYHVLVPPDVIGVTVVSTVTTFSWYTLSRVACFSFRAFL